MKIGLIDADLLDRGTNFPNLALLKISSYHKQNNDQVNLITYDDIDKYEQVFISKVFDYTKIPEEVLNPDASIFPLFPNTNILYGGSGFYFNKAPSLPNKIEHSTPDYSLYKSQVSNKPTHKYYHNFDIGFTTRYCFRQCPFCINKNKTKPITHSPPKEFITKNNKYISLLDDNFLSHPNWKPLLSKLKSYNKPLEFNSGLDIRLLTKEKAIALNNIKYYTDYFFAFDNLDEKDIILPKIKLWNKYKTKNTQFYLLTAYKSTSINNIVELFERIKLLIQHNSFPYIMRHKNYLNSKYKGMYIEIARWVNQKSNFKKQSFKEFCLCKGQNKITKKRYKRFINTYPNIANKYFNIKWSDT